MPGKNNVVLVLYLLLPITIVLLLLHVPYCSSFAEVEQEQEHDYDYSRGSGKGPEDWGKLNPQRHICNDGAMQSPIDLNNRVEVRPELGPLLRSYKPAQAAVTNRGHDIMVKWKQDAGILSIDGIEFRLIQCHWHSPSEHTFNGTSYDLELHMVHESTSGGIAVVAENYRYGEPDSFLAKIIPHIRDPQSGEVDVGIVDPRDLDINDHRYFRYMGSLTTPPCTEGVIWTIVNKIKTVSREQVNALREAVDDGFEANARPIQARNDRTVLMFYEVDPQ